MVRLSSPISHLSCVDPAVLDSLIPVLALDLRKVDVTTNNNTDKLTLCFRFPHRYGDPFPDELLAASGVSEQPSEYGPQHYLQTFPGRVRNSKLRQGVMAGSKPRHLLPWLTACTYGQMEAPLLLASTLHMFGAGATGFSFFIDSCMDDGAKFLALATAIQYVTSPKLY